MCVGGGGREGGGEGGGELDYGMIYQARAAATIIHCALFYHHSASSKCRLYTYMYWKLSRDQRFWHDKSTNERTTEYVR